MDTVEQLLPQDQPFILPDHVSFLLERAGVANPRDWTTGLDPEAFTSPDVQLQRKHVNRHLLYLFAQLATDADILKTRNARGCLMGAELCPLEDWLRLFEKEVIPCLIEVGLLQKTN